MLEMIYNIELDKNVVSDKKSNFFDAHYQSDLSKSYFHQLNQCLIREKIEFNDFFIEEKKDDKNILCSNFIINDLLNILNKKDISFDSKKSNNIKNNKIQKKKLDKDQDNFSDIIHDLKDLKNSQKNKIKEIFKILQTGKLSRKFKKYENQLSQMHQSNNIKIKNNLNLKKINISNLNKNNTKIVKDEKQVTSLLDFKKNKNILFFSKNINNIDNVIQRKSLLKFFNKPEYIKSNIKPLILNDTKNSIEWKKLINNKILLSISNKNNHVEIHLKPESLGSIHVLINMQNNAAKLQFISNCNNVRTFLDKYMPFLRNSLKENGIKLEEFNICGSLQNKKFTIYKNLFYKNLYNVNSFKKKINIYEKKIDLMQHKPIDIYV